MNLIKIFGVLISVTVLILVTYACNTYYFRSNYSKANSLLHKTDSLRIKPYLKAHLKNGDVLIMKDRWKIDTLGNVLLGAGIRYDFNREVIKEGDLAVSLDSVVIYETNKSLKYTQDKRSAALVVLSVFDFGVTSFCMLYPKMCFGSCPTFYINENDNFRYADAEGFSSAILPSLEYADIDALDNNKIQNNITNNELILTLKNEALETHCIKDIKLLAVPKINGRSIYHSINDKFYLCDNKYEPINAKNESGDLTSLIKFADRNEYFRPADENNLSTKEEIVIDFDDIINSNSIGLNIHFRQSLMTSYLFYNSMSYMGDLLSDFFASLETNPEMMKKMNNGMKKELGGIDVYLWNNLSNKWENQGSLNENGPIAINRQFLPLNNSNSNSKVKIKLVLNKGLWRIDYLALSNIIKEVKPTEIKVSEIENSGNRDKIALNQLNNPDKYLITLPGDKYLLKFNLPKNNTEYDYFLYSKGYYLEWMRQSWLAGKDLIKLNMMFDNPKLYLKMVAKDYKNYEYQMEEDFWNSKIESKGISKNEK
jgi:hypothetical protein